MSSLRARDERRLEFTDCPCTHWLEEPFGERLVIDLDTGDKLPFFIPSRDEDRASEYVPRPAGDLWERPRSDDEHR